MFPISSLWLGRRCDFVTSSSPFFPDGHGRGGLVLVVVIPERASFVFLSVRHCETVLSVGRFVTTVWSLHGSTRCRSPHFRDLVTCARRLRCLGVSLLVRFFVFVIVPLYCCQPLSSSGSLTKNLSGCCYVEATMQVFFDSVSSSGFIVLTFRRAFSPTSKEEKSVACEL